MNEGRNETTRDVHKQPATMVACYAKVTSTKTRQDAPRRRTSVLPALRFAQALRISDAGRMAGGHPSEGHGDPRQGRGDASGTRGK